ncbi:hypothetical protein AOQ84DRAFT_220765 [Glonium stellatum]|uniref:Uncharacterized protein n=1 Tax=Glonium stellatum TaxID=574774 RepID=A0A8E2F2S8_9PEZI|nr:hypothetical protein AOQ84DRAFT_220765 [Glonium stellatum]
MLRLDAPITPVRQSHAGVHRGCSIWRTAGFCVPCAGKAAEATWGNLGRLRLLLHGARRDGAYHQRRRFKLETCNVAARGAARRRRFLLPAWPGRPCARAVLASRACPRPAHTAHTAHTAQSAHTAHAAHARLCTSVHTLSPCTVTLPWAGRLGRTLLRIDSIATKLCDRLLLCPNGPRSSVNCHLLPREAQEPFPFTECHPHQSLPLLGLCREEQGQHDASDLPLAVRPPLIEHPSTLPSHYALDDTSVCVKAPREQPLTSIPCCFTELAFGHQESCSATVWDPPPQKGRPNPLPVFLRLQRERHTR